MVKTRLVIVLRLLKLAKPAATIPALEETAESWDVLVLEPARDH